MIALNEILDNMQGAINYSCLVIMALWSDTSDFADYSTIIPDDSNLKLNKMLNPSLLLYEHGKKMAKLLTILL